MRRALNYHLVELLCELRKQGWVMGCAPIHYGHHWSFYAAYSHSLWKTSHITLTFLKEHGYTPTNELCDDIRSIPWERLRIIETIGNVPMISTITRNLLAVSCDLHTPKKQRIKYLCKEGPRWLSDDREVHRIAHNMRSQAARLARWKHSTLLPVELIQHIAADLFSLTWV